MKKVLLALFCLAFLNASAKKDTELTETASTGVEVRNAVALRTLTEDEYRNFLEMQSVHVKAKAADEKTVNGASKWHGKVVSEVKTEDKNHMYMTYAFEDGWELVVKSNSKKTATGKTPEEIADLKAKRQKELEKRIPKGAAKQKADAEFDPVKTNEVSVVITPQK